MGLYQVGNSTDLSAQRLGDTTNPVAGSVNEQLSAIKGYVDNLEATIGGSDPASPPANSLLDRVGSLVSSLAIAASPVASSVQARIQAVIDLIGAVPTPGGTTLQGRIQSILDAVGVVASPVANSLQARIQSILDAVGVVESPVANSLQARIQLIADRVGDIASPAAGSLIARIASLVSGLGATNDAQATSDTGTFSAIALLKLIAARVNRANTAATTTNPPITSSSTPTTLFTGNGKGYKIFNPATNATTILVREGAAPTAALYSYLVPPGFIYFDDYNYSGSVQALLQDGSTNTTVMCTVH